MSESGDINATDDESDAGISPVPCALTNETTDTTEAVSVGQSTRQDPLTHGSNGPRTEDLGSGRSLVGEEDDATTGASYTESENDDEDDATTGTSYAESEDDGEEDTTLDGWYTESEEDSESEDSYGSKEDEDSAPSTPRWDPSTYVYFPDLDFPQQSPLPPLPMNETYYPEDELADDERDSELSSSGCESDRDVKREEVDVDLETDVPIRRPSLVHRLGQAASDRQLSVSPRIGENDMSQECLRRAGQGRGDVRGDADAPKGRKRGSDDEDEIGDRAHKIQRRL